MELNKLVFFTAVLLMLTACSSSSDTSTPLYQGTTGVVLSFPDASSFKQFTQDTFTVAVRLENSGAQDIRCETGVLAATYDNSLLKFEGLQSDNGFVNASVSPANTTFKLNGRSLFVNKGDVSFTEFTFTARNLTGNRETATATVTFTACYPYQTHYNDSVCIDRDYYSQAQQVCTSHPLSSPSQGAPVAVTSVQPRFNRLAGVVQPQFVIHLTNLNNGYVIFDNSSNRTVDNCQLQDFNRTTFGRAYVDARLNNIPLSCGTSGDGIAKFDTNGADIVCKLLTPIESGANYETPLFITLHYFYISTLSGNVDITRW